MAAGTIRPLVVDIALDVSKFSKAQSLVIVDEAGKKHNVATALQDKAQMHAQDQGSSKYLPYERWIVSLDMSSSTNTSQSDPPPNVYKKGVVLIRSLFTTTNLLPGAKVYRRSLETMSTGQDIQSSYSISQHHPDVDLDTLRWPLYQSSKTVTKDYTFEPLVCSFGTLHISVTYRANTNFQVMSTERLLSAQIASVQGSSSRASASASDDNTDSRFMPWARMSNQSAAISSDGSHVMPSAEQAPTESSAPRAIVRNEQLTTSVPRRPSTSFQPFKAGSLSSSPAGVGLLSGSPSSSLGYNTGNVASNQLRKRSSMSGPVQQASRAPSTSTEPIAEPVLSPNSHSPKPAIQRYSSSFGNRKARIPSAGGAKVSDELDGGVSKGSVSPALRASTSIPQGQAVSTTTAQDESESIGDFLKMLDKSAKGLSAQNKPDQASVAAISQRTAAQYSKFSRMRESTTMLSESISSSLMLQKSSGSLNRQYHGTSPSLSMSPNKSVSPHTPHIPAIPSRLSNNSIAETSIAQGKAPQGTFARQAEGYDGQMERNPSSQGNTTAIDIPNSPRTYALSSFRRPSSVLPPARTSMSVDEEQLHFGMKSASLPNDDRHLYGNDDDEPLLFAMGELGLSSHRRI